MSSIPHAFIATTVTIAQILMGAVGVIDHGLTAIMMALGITNHQHQTFAVLVLVSFAVILVMRTVGGMLSWMMFALALLLVLHRVAPSFSGIYTVPSPAQQVNGTL